MRWTRPRGKALSSSTVRFAIVLLSILAWAQNTPNTPQVPASASAPGESPPAQTQSPRTSIIVIDAAHGGNETGAVLAPSILEKDITLSCARRLRQDLTTRGFAVSLLRDSDSALSNDQRAAMVNATRPGLYVALHAASLGSGIRIYSAMLPSESSASGPFLGWATAQSGVSWRSAAIQRELTAAIQKMGFPVRALSAPVRPLNNVVAPAIAIEIAPANGQVSQLASADYQQMTSAALATAIATAHAKLGVP